MTIESTLHDADAQTVLGIVDRRRGAIVSLLRELVRIPSETHPPGGDEKDAQVYVARVLRELGLDLDVFEPTDVPDVEQHPGWWPGLDYHDRPNVVGVQRGTGGGRSLILNGHIDVVPAGPREQWSVDPYSAALVDGHVVGRGAADMKGGVTAMIAALACILEAGLRPRGDVTLQSVVNEELGGFNGTVACCARGYRADAAIVTEPTGMRIIAAATGGQTYRATISGVPVHHGWWWKGVSALDKALVLKDALRSWEQLRAREPSPSPLPTAHPGLADTIWHLRAGRADVMATPADAELEFWVDVLPNEDREAVLRRFEAHVADQVARDPHLREHPPTLERALMRPFAGAAVDLDHPVIGALADAHGRTTGQQAQVGAGQAANDSMIFNLFSPTPAVVYGPGTTVTAHSPDERIAVDDLIAGTKALALTILTFCGYERETR